MSAKSTEKIVRKFRREIANESRAMARERRSTSGGYLRVWCDADTLELLAEDARQSSERAGKKISAAICASSRLTMGFIDEGRYDQVRAKELRERDREMLEHRIRRAEKLAARAERALGDSAQSRDGGTVPHDEAER